MLAATKNHILHIAVPSPLRHLFDYLPPQSSPPDKIKVGMRVLVPFGKREVVGVVMALTTATKVKVAKLKEVVALLDMEPLLSGAMLDLIWWTSDYYHHPIGDVINNVLPQLLRCKPKRKGRTTGSTGKKAITPGIVEQELILNAEQQAAVKTISAALSKFKTFLLDGVTGSGKTEVYLHVIAAVVALQRQALVLVPEINLTPQTIARFTSFFTLPLAVLHSRLTPKERKTAWLQAQSGEAAIVIGTRSAIFTPLKNPGIIIVDEEHDLSFKQQAGLRYSARDLAIMRGKLEQIPVVLGSATPSSETIYNVTRHNYLSLRLPKRVGGASHPTFHLVDMRKQKLKDGIVANLVLPLKRHLASGGQVLLFLNRRGYAPIYICHNCGWVASCSHCDARLTLHKKKHHLRCHHCGVVEKIPVRCPKCAHDNLLLLGTGTERVEGALQELFPEKRVVRIDRDTTRRKNSLEEIFKNIHGQEYQILLGTQMLAKGHHFPNVTMVAILGVDQGLFGTDFRASEHLAQLIIQVAGRAGRAEKPGEVYLQTHNPRHPLLLRLLEEGFQGFIANCLAERYAAQLPPYSYLALLHAESKQQTSALDFLGRVRAQVESKLAPPVKIFGPVPAVMERKAGYFRAQLLLQSQDRKKLQQLLDTIVDTIEQFKSSARVRWFLDVDPVELGN